MNNICRKLATTIAAGAAVAGSVFLSTAPAVLAADTFPQATSRHVAWCDYLSGVAAEPADDLTCREVAVNLFLGIPNDTELNVRVAAAEVGRKAVVAAPTTGRDQVVANASITIDYLIWCDYLSGVAVLQAYDRACREVAFNLFLGQPNDARLDALIIAAAAGAVIDA